MAIFRPHRVECVCGHVFLAPLADSLNFARSPEVRQRVLDGTLHRFECVACGQAMTVDKSFFCTDLSSNMLFKVLPSGERHMFKQASASLDRASSLIPADLAEPGRRTLRVCFGLDELREKLVAQDARFDDRIVELLKVLLVSDHPILLRRPRLRLTLSAVTEAQLEFLAVYEHDQTCFRLSMPRPLARKFAEPGGPALTWAQNSHQTSLFDVDDHWVNLWRWSPEPTALQRLKSFAAAACAGNDIDTASVAFRQMLGGVPRGSHLPSWAKQDLRSIFEYAKQHNLQQLEDQLFEIRFGFELDDAWSKNTDPNDIDTLWTLLKNLPESNIDGNTSIRQIVLDPGGGGLYDPQSHYVRIGETELADQEGFEDTVRHEVGHAVHESRAPLVNDWLAERFGWVTFGPSDGGLDAWVAAMGGWGPLTEVQRAGVRDTLREAIGRGQTFDAAPIPGRAADDPWNGADFGPRLAVEKSGSNWYEQFRTWHQYNGKAFFVNYWYCSFVIVDLTTLDFVANMPRSYAAMSHYEFFADLYALYYDLDDPMRPAIASDVTQWLEVNIGQPIPNAALRGAPAPKEAFEAVARPEGD